MKKFFPLAILALLLSAFANAQETDDVINDKKNILKVNLSGVALSHYSFQYERVVARKQSFCFGFGFSPNVDLPFKSTLSDQFGDDEQAARMIESTRFSKITITPEYRFYLGKKQAPQGFYIAPFARYVHMKLDQDYIFTPSTGNEHTAHIDGKMNGVGGGVMLGAQWLFGKKKNISFDWWIVGPFIGGMKADFLGTDPEMDELSASDRANLESDIESVDIPLWKVDATVNEFTVDAKLTGPFYGLRVMGFSIGFRF